MISLQLVARPIIKKSRRSQGFTLIELSIVLVIIGLIIGGILTGQDLINTATIRAQISQIEKYNTAVRTFQNKYGGLPGDLQLTLASQFGFSISGCNGNLGERDGNGIIDGYYPGYYVMEYFEPTLFWADLSQAGLVDGTFPSGLSYTGCGNDGGVAWTLTGGTYYTGNFLPSAKIGNGNFVYVYDSNTTNGGVNNDNWYGISAAVYKIGTGPLKSQPGISVIQAYSIDQKIDDGIPNTGGVIDFYLTSSGGNVPELIPANSQTSDSATSCYNSTTNKYSIGINGGGAMNCALSFKLQ